MAMRVYRLTERKRDKHGNPLLLPQSFDAQAAIDLYKDHATHEQFHAEVQE